MAFPSQGLLVAVALAGGRHFGGTGCPRDFVRSAVAAAPSHSSMISLRSAQMFDWFIDLAKSRTALASASLPRGCGCAVSAARSLSSLA
jgi:hypothetical protein